MRSRTQGILAFAGDAVLGAWLEEWAGNDCNPAFLRGEWDTDLNGEIIWIKPDKTIWFVEKGYAVRIECPFYAAGSGRELAMGAMAAGVTAEQAVNIATIFDNGTHGPTQIMPIFADNVVVFPKQ